MKPFNLEAAKAGALLVTREGESVKFIAHVPEANEGERVIVFSEAKAIRVYHESGNYYRNGTDGYDLFMAPQKKTVWVNIYANGYASYWNTEKQADDYAANRITDKAYSLEIED